MMWNTIANFKENLSQIAFEVQDAVEELEVYGSPVKDSALVSDRRASRGAVLSKSPLLPHVENGIDAGFKAEIERYKAEIQRLQASEAEVKALAINYASILKEKEEEVSRLNKETDSLSIALEATNAAVHSSRNENLRINNSNALKVGADRSSYKQKKLANQLIARRFENLEQEDSVLKGATSNGSPDATWSDGRQKALLKDVNFMGYDKERENLLEENKTLTTLHANHELEIKQLKEALDKEHENLVKMEQSLQEQREWNESSQKELHVLKSDKDKISVEINELHAELNEKISEIRRLQSELTRRDLEERGETTDSLQSIIATLEKENADLKREKGELGTALRSCKKGKPDSVLLGDSDGANYNSNKSTEALEKALSDAFRERNKALQELARLKQHLLDKELEESDKMDEDSKIIEELRANCEYQKAQILHLENCLKQAKLCQEEAKSTNNQELQKSSEIIDDLTNKLTSCMRLVDSKNVELSNLQSALGQYYAEIEAKECLERDLGLAREEIGKLSEVIKGANQQLGTSQKEKEGLLSEISKVERTLSENKFTMQKLEEENAKLRRALEQSMTRLNRMSMDSDYFVDRRIVIKLLVTYFQRNHSKEVLDLMVRMLGFSEEDKQRIGLAQNVAGKGVVRSVLGLPKSIVGGVFRGSSEVNTTHVPYENQSFTDLWVDFLLKETEERERRGIADSANASSERNPSAGRPPPPSTSNHPPSLSGAPSVANQISSPLLGKQQSEYMTSQFSTVPLASPNSVLQENNAKSSRMLPRYEY